MSEAFWWYVLAGFLLGFSVSTLWEWIYFRRRRMNIRDRRIAELEATVRAYTAAASVPNVDAVTDDWAEPTFQSPGVYLETEEAPPSPPAPDTLSSTQSPSPAVVTAVTTVTTGPSRINGVSSAMTQPAGGASATVTAVSVPGGFQSLAVQHPPPPSRATTQPEAATAAEDSRIGDVLAALGAATVVSHVAGDATQDATAVVSATDADERSKVTTPVYANGATGAPTLAEANHHASRSDLPAITSAEIGVLVSSINELIDLSLIHI